MEELTLQQFRTGVELAVAATSKEEVMEAMKSIIECNGRCSVVYGCNPCPGKYLPLTCCNCGFAANQSDANEEDPTTAESAQQVIDILEEE